MNKIFIEAKHDKTSEYNFLKTILAQYFGVPVKTCVNNV